MTDFHYSQQVARRSGSNFYFSFFFLPKEKREGILAIYAFSRLLDDAVDEAPNEESARQQAYVWRQRLQACYDLKSEDGHPLLPELRETIRRFAIPQEYFSSLLDGVEMDLIKKRYQTFGELENYCYHVASTIGLLCNQLFGYPTEDAKKYAILLGKALQLTNIIRDVGVDARKDRIYLPKEELQRFGVAEQEILEGRSSENFLKLMSFQSERAEDYFQKAYAALASSKRKRLIPAEVMGSFYHAILKKIKKKNFPVFETKVGLSGFQKLGLSLKVLLRSL